MKPRKQLNQRQTTIDLLKDQYAAYAYAAAYYASSYAYDASLASYYAYHAAAYYASETKACGEYNKVTAELCLQFILGVFR